MGLPPAETESMAWEREIWRDKTVSKAPRVRCRSRGVITVHYATELRPLQLKLPCIDLRCIDLRLISGVLSTARTPLSIY
jgi:hypothetical protein